MKMKRYKPEHMGRVMPEDTPELTDFMHNKYDGFSKIYDTVKDDSEDISDVKSVKGKDPSKLNVKVSAGKSTLDKINKKIKDSGDSSIQMDGDIITA
jgi:predicted  nucleic acid-binding Zn-ribbon protein